MSKQLKTEYCIFHLNEVSGMGQTEINIIKVGPYKQFENEEEAKVWIQVEGKNGQYIILPVYTNR
jgi:hypothetical protein